MDMSTVSTTESTIVRCFEPTVRIRPEQITHRTVVGYFLLPVYGSNLRFNSELKSENSFFRAALEVLTTITWSNVFIDGDRPP